MEEKIWKAALAGLLHDVGKIEQRARINPWEPAGGFEGEGQPVHATWTASFIQAYVPDAYKSALHGAYHHAPTRSKAEDTALSELVELADKLSAGERSDRTEKTAPKDPPQQMVTIFDRLRMQGEPKAEHYLPLKPLALDEKVLFPTGKMDSKERVKAYETLRDVLRTAANGKIDDPAVYIENLLAGLQRAAWCVPSAYYHSVPDVSLYDHSRMTAALAVCLTDFSPEQIKAMVAAVRADFSGQSTPAQKTTLEQPAALLIGGDISGIQDFIYTISSKNAAQTLRGRSFYLQLLTEAILRFVLQRLDLPATNVIYAGGGHFFLLAPLSAARKLDDLRREITERLLTHHRVSLYLALAGAEVPSSGFRIGAFPRYWGEMHRALGRVKQSRYLELGETAHERVFGVPEFGGNPEQTCSVCGEDYRPAKKLEDAEEERARICSLCASFGEEIGANLPHSRFVAIGLGQPQSGPAKKASDVLASFGLEFHLLRDDKTEFDFKHAERVLVWALDDPGDNGWPQIGRLPQANLVHYTVNQKPNGTFDELQEKVDGGFKRLGVLRMDVDNLGDLFSTGFGNPGDPQNTATLARLSTLSFQISLYFEGWVKRLCEKYPEKVYAVYAGGDDLFLIGPWDIMPSLAQDIYDDFKRYTGQHPALHISGGLAFIGGKYPVYQAAGDAEDAEMLAKAHPGKDAFSFLGQSYSWAAFKELAEAKGRLVRLVTEPGEEQGLGGPKGVIQQLRQFAGQESAAARKQGRPVWGPWIWQSAYQFKRMGERYEKQQPDTAQEITAIQTELSKNNYKNIQLWGAAARWAQLVTRQKKP